MINRLIQKIQETKAPICVGLDPMLNYIPEHILEAAYGTCGETLEAPPRPSGSTIRRSSTTPGI